MDEDEISAFVGDGPDSNFIRSILTPAPEDYETDLIRFIKESKVIPEGIIKREGGGITVYEEDGTVSHCGVATAHSIESDYKYTYIKYRDKATIEKLKDADTILFDDENVETESGDSGSDEDSLSTFSGGLTYDAFMKATFKLNDPDEIVLAAGHMNVHFSYPCWQDQVTFSLCANDPIRGFTRLELATKVMRRFHLLYYLCFNYSVEEGQVNPHKASGLFAPVIRESEYTDNGLAALTYDKKLNRWVVECMEYI